jgi:type IV pilus assembly protein PilW
VKGNVGSWKTANQVGDWANVVAVRVSLLLRSNSEVQQLELPTTARMNGVDITFPTDGPRFDRRVFTTTIALRNRVAYRN